MLRLIFGLLACVGTPSLAQTVIGGPQAIEACKTTAGDDGILFHGYFGMVHAPVGFDQVRTEEGKLSVIPGLVDGFGVLAFGRESAGKDALVEFIAADGTVVHQCSVKIAAFDPEIDDLARLQAGDCNLKVVAGRSPLMVGHGQVLEVPQELVEAAIGPVAGSDVSTLSNRRLYLFGRSPGVTVLLWTVEEAEGSVAINLCPLTVADPMAVLGAVGPDDKDLCQDANGAPIRLSVGQTATMEFRDRDGLELEFYEAAIAAPSIADFSFAEGKAGATIKGLATGFTSLTLLNHDAMVAQNCEIVVE